MQTFRVTLLAERWIQYLPLDGNKRVRYNISPLVIFSKNIPILVTYFYTIIFLTSFLTLSKGETCMSCLARHFPHACRSAWLTDRRLSKKRNVWRALFNTYNLFRLIVTNKRCAITAVNFVDTRFVIRTLRELKIHTSTTGTSVWASRQTIILQLF